LSHGNYTNELDQLGSGTV